MSQENVEIVRRSGEAWSRGDLDGVVESYDPEIEWDMSSYLGWPEAQVYRGHKAVRDFFEQWLGAWESYEAEVKELVDAGDRVVSLAWQRGRFGGSEAKVENRYAQVFTLSEGKIVRVQAYSDPAKALEDAGLPESERAEALEAVGLRA